MLLLKKILSCTCKKKIILSIVLKMFSHLNFDGSLMLTYGNVPLLPEPVESFGNKVIEKLKLGSFAKHLNSII